MRDRLLKTFAGIACRSRKVFQAGLLGAALATSFVLFSPLIQTAYAANPLIHNSTYGGTGKYGTWGQSYTCATCHTKGATPNIKKVSPQILTPTGMRKVVFTRYTSMSRTIQNRYTAMSTDAVGILGNDRRTVNQQRSQNVCEVCHHRTTYHQYSASKIAAMPGGLSHTAHKSNNRDCTACHAHRNAFKRPAIESCDACHGDPPTTATIGAPTGLYTNVYGDPPTAVGAHAKHRNVLRFECQVCHNNYGHGLLGNDYVELGFRIVSTNWRPFVGEVTTGTITVSNSSGLNTVFSLAPNNPNTTLLKAPGVMSCNIYCHGDNWNVHSGRVGSGVSWTQGPLGSCSNSVCHGASRQNPPTPVLLGNVSTGAHKTHVGKLGNDDVKCATCHESLPDPHMVNGRVNVNMSQANAGTPASGIPAKYNGFTLYSTQTLAASGTYYSCSNIYCHSNVQGSNGTGAPTTFTPATWGGGYVACDSCHGGQRTNATPISSGAHSKHIATSFYRYSCDACHTDAGRSDQLKHANKTIEVTMAGTYGGTYSQTTNVPGDGFGSCSNVNCHYGQSVGWNDGVLNCNACHGSDAVTLTSGRHAGHISTTANPNLGTAMQCAACHAPVVSSNTTVSNYLRHANGFSDYSGRNAGRSYTAATGVCSNVYCHTDGKGRQNVAFDAANGWNSATVYADCKGCHGNDAQPGSFAGLVGEPNYQNATETQPRANSHERHMGGTGLNTCVYCHASTVTVAGAILANSSTHTNRRLDVLAGGGKTFGYVASTRTCSNINCHGIGSRAVRWGEVFPVDCTGCHGNNAVSFRALTTGKHTAHINQATVLGKNYRCNVCHALTAGVDDRSILDTSMHGNGFKNFTGVMAGGRGSYNLTTGVCSANYCHSDGKGVQNVPFTLANGWKSTVTLDCKGCHGNSTAPDFTSVAGEPNYASTAPGSLRANDHKNHVDFGGSTCINCHADTANGTGTILANVSTHVNKRIDVKSGNGKSFTYVAATKDCSDISCHGGVGSSTQRWGTPVSANCTGCHDNNVASLQPISSGRHKAHINNAETLGTNYRCNACHAQTVNADDRTFANRQLHGNSLVNYSGVRAGRSYTSATGSCANLYCHSDGKGRQNVAFTLANGWKSGKVYNGCKGCHGNDATLNHYSSYNGEPNYQNAGANLLRSNSHEKHVTLGAASCTLCHSTTVNASNVIFTGSTTHTNGRIEVQAGGTASFSGWSNTTKNCSNISCHFNQSAVWGATLNCNSCHGSDAATLTTKRHSGHISPSANPSLGTAIRCSECHVKTVYSDNLTIKSSSAHVNNVMGDYSGSKAGRYTAVNGVCANVYCHTDGKGVQNVPFTVGNGWNSSVTYSDCNGCHGNSLPADFTASYGQPNYVNAGANLLRSNSHKSHASAGASTCVSCHGTTTNASGAIFAGSSTHINRRIEVVQGGAATFGWDTATKGCNNISCHGPGSTAVWGDPNSAGCTVCHGSNWASANPIATGKHTAHINNAVSLGSNYSCDACHAAAVSGDSTLVFVNGTTAHNNGFKNYSGRWAGRAYSAATGVCSNVYCHSDGKGRQNVAFTAGNGWNSATVYNDCKKCHGNDATLNHYSSYNSEPNYQNSGANQLRSNSHQKHVTLGAASCVLCHVDTVNSSNLLLADTRHADGVMDVRNGGTAVFNWTGGKTCTNISCHFNASAVWGATLDCNSCHGSDAVTLTSKKHSGHISTSLNPSLGTAIGCAECHAKTVNNDNVTIKSTAIHYNGILGDYSGARAGSYTPATGVCANSYCHTDGKGRVNAPFNAGTGWNSAVVYGDCKGCHGNDTAPAFTSAAGEPNYANTGLPGSATANSHNSHVTYYGGAASCDYCHTNSVTTNGLAAKPGGSHLINGINVDFNRSIEATAVWNGTLRTCGNIACHSGSGATWGDAASVGCKVCHGTLLSKPGVHATHVGDLLDSITFYGYTAIKSSNGVYRIGCANCHPTIEAGNHKNGSVQVTINRNKSGRSWIAGLNDATADGINAANSGITGTTKVSVTCSMVYCHSSGRSTTQAQNDFRTTPNWYSTAGSTANRCGMCHENPPQYAGQSHYVNPSTMGINGTGPYKDSGHLVGIHFKNTYKGPGRSGFLGYSSAGDKAHGNAGVATTMSCDICHSGIVDPAKPDTYAMFGTGKKFECAQCHTASTPTRLQAGNITGTGLHINGKKDVVFTSAPYLTKAQLSNVANAGGVWMRNGGYKEAGSYDSTDLSTSTWEPSTKTCLTACHVNQPAIRWGQPLNCSSCHANQ